MACKSFAKYLKVLLIVLIPALFTLACSEQTNTREAPKGSTSEQSTKVSTRSETAYNVTINSTKPEYVAMRLSNIIKKLEINDHSEISLQKEIDIKVPAEKYLDFLRLLQDIKHLRVKRKTIEREINDSNTIIFTVNIIKS